MVKTNWREFFNSKKDTLVGLNTAISSPFISIGLFINYLSMLVLGDGLCPSILLAVLAGGLFLYVDSIHRLKKIKNVSELMQVPWTSVISWSIFEGNFKSVFKIPSKPAFLNPWKSRCQPISTANPAQNLNLVKKGRNGFADYLVDSKGLARFFF